MAKQTFPWCMRVFDSSPDSIREIAALLDAGEVVALPTETVYGLAADALNPDAVRRIFTIKGRPSHNPLIVHVHGPQIVERYARVNSSAEKLMHAFWPGPLTLVMEKTNLIPSIVSAGLSTVGIRCPNQKSMLAILRLLDRPLAAPSANPSNYISPTRVDHVDRGLGASLAYALDGGPCPKGVESTILDVTDPNRIVLLRPGPITPQEIASQTGMVVHMPDASEPSLKPSSPGQLAKHYSPKTPLYIGTLPHLSPVACLHFSKDYQQRENASPHDIHFFLSSRECSEETERNLYDLLQRVDQQSFACILVDPIPEGDKWNTVRDRLKRASHA